MPSYIHRCRFCGKKYVSVLSIGYKCADCIAESRAQQRVTFQRDSGPFSSALMGRGDAAALAASFFRQPRGSNVKAREVMWKNGGWGFREEYW
jgi:hypothetical protein